jgi:hypothetical protein
LFQGEETTKWLWERQFAAVVSDSPGFEVRRKYHDIGAAVSVAEH